MICPRYGSTLLGRWRWTRAVPFLMMERTVAREAPKARAIWRMRWPRFCNSRIAAHLLLLSIGHLVGYASPRNLRRSPADLIRIDAGPGFPSLRIPEHSDGGHRAVVWGTSLSTGLTSTSANAGS